MNNKTILSVYCYLKPDQIQEGQKALIQMVKSLNSEMNSRFFICSGSPSGTSDEVAIHLCTDVPGAAYDEQQARDIAKKLFGQLNSYKKYIEIQTSEVKSSFPIDEGDVASEDNKYTYTLEEVLPL